MKRGKLKFEIFFEEDKISLKDWRSIEERIEKYDEDLEFEVVLKEGTFKFFLYAKKDISALSARLKGIVFKRERENKPELLKIWQKNKPVKKRLFRIKAGEDLVKVLEKEKVKRGRELALLYVKKQSFLKVKFYKVIIVVKEKGRYFYDSYFSFFNPVYLFAFDFSDKAIFRKKKVPLYLDIADSLELFGKESPLALLEVDGFPFVSTNLYFSIKKFDILKHSLIVGQTGVGKSKFLELLIRRLGALGKDYCVVLIDPHASLERELVNLPVSKVSFDFVRSSCDLFSLSNQPKVATELMILLFKTLLGKSFNSKLERVLKYSFYVLFKTNLMGLLNLKKFLVDLEFRKKILDKIGSEDEFLKHFFETEFNEISTKFYEIAIMPLLVLVDEMSFIPAFEEKGKGLGLAEAMEKNFLVSFPLNRIFLGEKATKLIAGLVIQQVFLIAQSGRLAKKVVLMIDEVSVVENEALISILSEARKFNLALYLSQQYLTQVSSSLLKSALSNVYNYFVFKVADEDAKILAKNLTFKFPERLVERLKRKGKREENLRQEFLVSLNPREVAARVFYKGKFYPCFKGRTIEI